MRSVVLDALQQNASGVNKPKGCNLRPLGLGVAMRNYSAVGTSSIPQKSQGLLTLIILNRSRIGSERCLLGNVLVITLSY